MPDMTPLGNTGVVPSPTQGLNTLSSILGVQQQRQALQTGQYAQATAEAESTQKQQQSAELQAAQTLAKNGVQSGAYTNPDGTFNRQKMSDDISKVAPTYGQSIANQLLSGANEVVANKNAIQNLNQAQQGQLSGMFQSLATKKDLSKSDIVDAFNTMADLNPTPEFRRMLMSGLTHIPPDGDPQKLQGIVQQMASGLSGQAQQTPSSMDTGAAVQPGATNRFSGGFTPAGEPITKQLGPSQQLPYVRSAAAASTEGGQGAANDEQLYNNIVQEGTKATQIKSLSQDIQKLAGEVQTGSYSKGFANKWAAAAQTLGLSPENMTAATRRQILSKMTNQLKIQSEAGASTDAERGSIESAMPNPEEMTPQAVQQAARYVGAQADVKASRMDLANRHRQVNGGKSTGIRDADSQFMQHADPRIFEYQSIPAGKERQDYLKQHFSSAAEVTDFLKKADTLKAYGALK